MGKIKIFKSLDEQTTDDKFKGSFGLGTIQYVSWETIMPYVEHCITKDVNDKVEGIKIDEKGIHVKIVKNESRR